MGDTRGSLDQDTLSAALLAHVGKLRPYIEYQIPRRFRGLISPDDILHDVWLSASQANRKSQPIDRDELEYWLLKIASSELTNAIRAVRFRKRGGGAGCIRNADARMSSFSAVFDQLCTSSRTPSREFHAIEASHAVLVALQQLSDARRRAIEMRYVDGLSLKEIAGRMGRSEAAVNSLLHQGRRQLRRILGDASKYFSDAPSSDGVRQST